jgi:hypothetical protein
MARRIKVFLVTLQTLLVTRQTIPQVRHFLDGQALEIKNQCQLGLGEEPFELSDDLLLVLQSAAHDDWIGLKEQAGHAADRVS